MATSTIPMNNYAKSAFLSWGTSLIAQNFNQGIMVYNAYTAITIWMPSTDTVTARWIGSDGQARYKTSDNNEIAFSVNDIDGTSIRLTRSDRQLTATLASNASAVLIYQ